MKRLIFAAVLLSGCTSYRHARYADGKLTEETHLRAPFLTKTAIAGLKTRVSDKHGTDVYTRSVGVESATGQADAEGIDAINRFVGQAILSAAKVAAPIPK